MKRICHLAGAALLMALAVGCMEGGKLHQRAMVHEPSRIGFYTPASVATEAVAPWARRLSAEHGLDAIFVLSSRGEGAALWSHLLRPAEALASVRDESLLAPWVADMPDGHLHSADIGPVHFTIIEDPAAALANDEARRDLIAALSQSHAPWKVALLPRPIINEEVSRDLEGLSYLLERLGVQIVIASGESHYIRTAPVGRTAEKAIRHILLPIQSGPGAPEARAEWVTRRIENGHYALLSATTARLTWVWHGADGRLLDVLEMRRATRQADAARFFTFNEIVAALRDRALPREAEEKDLPSGGTEGTLLSAPKDPAVP